MTDDQLVAHIELLESQASDAVAGSVAAEQAKAMDYYLGRPFGTEEEGRSAVISSDVWDVVEGLTPLVLKPFVSSDDIVRFSPEGPEDEAAAEQESDYINYVVTQKNDVFDTLVTWVKTGLLQKNGIVKYWWEKSRRTSIERYYGLTDDQFALLLNEESVEVSEHSETKTFSLDPETGEQIAETSHDVVLRITEMVGEPRYAVIPPEEFKISRGATSGNPKLSRFVEHVTFKTISELREMGYDVDDDVNDTGPTDPRTSEQYTSRHADQDGNIRPDEGNDPSTREVMFREVYMLVDFDGDGMAELRKVCLVGKTILANEETEEIPFVGWTPYPQPFQFHGRCPADETTEIQLIKSTVLRQTMDNIYTVNNNTRYVSGKVNLDDLLDNQIAGIVRVDGDVVGNHVMPAPITPIGAITMPMVEYFDSAKENRTGFTRYNQGTDSNSLNKTATGVRIIAEAGNERVGLVSRCFAEQGLKPLMLGIHGLVRRHSNKKEMIRLRGKWAEVDPRSWKTRYDMSVSVGLGAADKQMQMQGAQLLLDTQLKLIGSGVVQPENVYEAGAKLAQALGEKNPDKFFSMPKDQAPPPPPDPMQDPAFQLQVAELELKKQAQQAADARAAAELQLKEQEVAIKDRDSQINAGIKAAELQNRDHEWEHSSSIERARLERELNPPEVPEEEEDPMQREMLDAIKAMAKGMSDMQASLQRMAEQANKPRTLRVKKNADGSFVGMQEETKE